MDVKFYSLKKVLLVFAALIIGIVSVLHSFTKLNMIENEEGVELRIRKGDTFEDVKNQLLSDGQYKIPFYFETASKLLKYDKNIKSGRYLIPYKSSTVDIVRKLRSGNQDAVKIIIHNVTFPVQLASKVSMQLDIDSAQFVQFILDSVQASEYGFNTENFWSMYLSNSYQIYWDVGIEGFAQRMQQEYNRFWNEERKSKSEKIGLTPEEVIVLASIVQKETNHKPEYGTVASVYLNRLKKGMLLQADPTVKFALGDMSIKRILAKDLDVDSPYNTYKYAKLPPGPICLPELDVVESVLNAPSDNYLYFCAVYGTGKHAFARTYSEHLINARAYQRALNQEKIFR